MGETTSPAPVDEWIASGMPERCRPPSDEDGWVELLRLLPGYDPFEQAGDCWFDEEKALHVIGFFHDELTHTEGALAQTPLWLERWEQAFVANLFGWQKTHPSGKAVRRYREALLYVPRKNGKTPLVAGICDYVLFCDGEKGAQIYSAAGDTDQATILYKHASGMVRQSPNLSRVAKIYGGVGQRSIVYETEGSSYKVLSSSAETKHGGNSHLVAIDELHVQPNRDLVDVMQTSMASANRLQPMMLHITTADFDRESICNEKHDYACKVRDGVVNDPAFLPAIYEASEDDDWTSEEVWEKANPNLDVSVSREYLRRECMRAQETPTYENTFKRLHLNIKTQQDVRWIVLQVWDKCARGVSDPKAWRDEMIERMRGKPCWGGLDLASSSDTNALVLAFREDDDVIWLPWFWIPGDKARAREKRDRVPYIQWAQDGFITMTDGEVADYDVIRRDINDIADKFGIQELAVDRLFQGAQLSVQLMGDGLEVVTHGQGFASMTAPSKAFEDLVTSSRLRHGANPILRWQASHVAAEMDAAGNIKPSRKKSTEKIDGIVAGVMACGRMEASLGPTESVYESRGILTI